MAPWTTICCALAGVAETQNAETDSHRQKERRRTASVIKCIWPIAPLRADAAYATAAPLLPARPIETPRGADRGRRRRRDAAFDAASRRGSRYD